MRKRISLFLLKAYLIARKRISPIIYRKWYEVPINYKVWDLFKSMPMNDAEKVIRSYQYKSDLLNGLLDTSFLESKPDLFFQVLDFGRDCDDFARIWRLWATYNGMDAHEYVFIKLKSSLKASIETAHVVCIAKDKNDKYWLFNYNSYGPYSTFEKVIDKMSQDFNEESSIYAKYK